jgi:cytochrome c-type biogenesis protein
MAANPFGLVPFAFTLGTLTFFSPCAYPLLPGYVSYYLGRGGEPDGGVAAGPAATGVPTAAGRRARLVASRLPVRPATVARVGRAAVVGSTVSLGFFLVYGVLAGIVVTAGSELLTNVAVLELVVGVVLVCLGSAMAAGVDLPSPHVALPERERSLSGYFGFGVLYAAAAAGCSAPLFVGVALRSLSVGLVSGLVTLSAYALGMSVLMISVTVATALGRGVLLRRVTEHMGTVQRLGGVLLVLAGAYEVYLFLFEYGGREMLGV